MTYSITVSFRLKSAVTLAVASFFFVLLLGGMASWAQNADQPAAPSIAAGPQQSREEEAWEAQQRKKMAAEENVKREQNLKKDTAKLLELATELKQYVDKTNENMLSVEVIKKADEIEKLAHSVKEKMKGP